MVDPSQWRLDDRIINTLHIFFSKRFLKQDLHLLKPGQEKAREMAHLVDVHCNARPRIEACACQPGPGEVETGQSPELAS